MPSKDPEVQRRAEKNYRLNHPDKILAANRIANERSKLARAIVREERLAKQRAQKEREQRDQAKVCTACGVLKSFDDFRNDKYRPDGKSSKCRECMGSRGRELYPARADKAKAATKAWKLANVEEQQAYDKAYKPRKKALRKGRYEANREAVLAQNAAWYEENKDERKLSMAAWEEANKPKRKAQKAAQHLENPEKKRAANKAWLDAHPGYGAIKWQRRASRQAGAEIVDLSQEQWEEILERSNYRCCYCKENCKECKNKTHKFQQEHLTPVVKSGNYTVQNILPACPDCNAKKGAGDVLKPVQPFLLTEAPPHTPKRKKKGA